jgi:hypothetical protein
LPDVFQLTKTLLVAAIIIVAPRISSAAAANNKVLATPTWTDPEKAAADDPDFLIQGEYGVERGPAPWGAQVVALGGGKFEGYLLAGGLPGAGWKRGQLRVKVSGKREGEIVKLINTDQMMSVIICEKTLEIFKKDELIAKLPRVERKSPSLGATPPAGAVVLFDGTSSDAWINGQVEHGLLLNNDITSKQTFRNYFIHLEFRTPYKPYARGQQRGNSGIYHQGRYETQVLDSFGLEGRKNEAGGIYSIAAPSVNACLPPLVWQTYDIDFHAARFDSDARLAQPAKMTVTQNGIVVQNDQPLPHTTTAAPIKTITDTPGPIFLQHHRNPVYYRNIWIVPK